MADCVAARETIKTMVAWLRLLLLAVVISSPTYAACPWLTAKVAPDCCPRNRRCPRPVKLDPQTCFNCVAEVRPATLTTVPTAVVPVTLALHTPFVTPSKATLLHDGPITDKSNTFLRTGVLRL